MSWRGIHLVFHQFVVCACMLLVACNPSTPGMPRIPTQNTTDNQALIASPSSEPNPNASIASLPADAPSPTSEPTLTPPPPENPHSHTQYTLTARFDYASHYLSVQESVLFTNTTTVPLPDLLFVVEPNRYPGAFRLNNLTGENGTPVSAFKLEANKLLISLSQPLLPSQVAHISFDYELFLPPIPPPSETTRPVPFGYTLRQTNLVDWYPFLPPYDVEHGWRVHNPWYYGEHQVYDVADYQVNIQLAPGGTQPTIAASAPAEQDGAWLRYKLEHARSFALSAGLEYVVFTQKVGEVTIWSYAFPFDQIAGQAVLRETAAALELYSELFGAYPHESLSVVEADFLDGMEYEGLFFLSRGFYNLYDGTHKGYLTAIAAHETAHQWWYGKVGNDQALEPWLDEALCTYSERLFYEHIYPDLVDWWWSFRVDFYQPTGAVNGRLYDFNGFRPYVNAVYLRGARFLEELRNTIGDEAFYSFLKAYALRNNQRLATQDDFFNLLAEYTSADLQGLREKYFR